jgi:hypothetical protein
VDGVVFGVVDGVVFGVVDEVRGVVFDVEGVFGSQPYPHIVEVGRQPPYGHGVVAWTSATSNGVSTNDELALTFAKSF